MWQFNFIFLLIYQNYTISLLSDHKKSNISIYKSLYKYVSDQTYIYVSKLKLRDFDKSRKK